MLSVKSSGVRLNVIHQGIIGTQMKPAGLHGPEYHFMLALNGFLIKKGSIALDCTVEETVSIE